MKAPSGRPRQPRKSPRRSMQHGRKLARFHGKPDKTGDAVGRPSCPSSLLSDPNATFSVEMWRKPQRTRKIKKQETAGRWTCRPKRNKNGDKTMEGRNVGLDFYDLLIEAIEAAVEATKLSELSDRKSVV